MKKCTKCGEVKPLDEFSRKADAKDGKHPICKACDASRRRLQREQNIERERRRDLARYPARRDEKRAYNAGYYESKKARIKAAVDARRQRLKDTSEFRAANAARQAKRNAIKHQATPPWADHQKIRAVYAWAKHLEPLGINCEVDHIVPLRGKNVCGLHVHDNLRVVIDVENRSKGARMMDPFEPCEYDMPGFREWLAVRVSD